MKSTRVTKTSEIRPALDSIKKSKVVAVEPFSRMPLGRFGLLDTLSIMEENLESVVTFDIASIVAEIAGYPAGEDADPASLLQSLAGPQQEEILADSKLQDLIMFLEDKKVTKVAYDGRQLGDALLHQLKCRISLVIDIRILPMYCGFQETNPARRHRGVVKLPPFGALLPFAEAATPSNLHAVIAIYQKVKDNLKNGSRTISETAVASGRYLDSLRKLDAVTPESFHPYLPLGVVSSAQEDWLPCNNCRRPAPHHFLTAEDGICNVCNEVRQPCLAFRRGMCDNVACDYVHQRLACPKGDNCIDRHMGFCAYVHENDDVVLSSEPTPVQLRSTSPFNRNQKLSSPEVHQLVAQNFEKGTPVMSAAASADVMAATQDSSEGSSTGFTVTDATATSSGRGRKAASPNSPTNPREWTAPSTNKPFLPPRSVPPCHYHFGPVGCARGGSCRFSHEPVPLYLPVPVVHNAADPLHRQSIIPCPVQLSGRTCQEKKCSYLHLPADIPVAKKKWTQNNAAADPLKPRSASRAGGNNRGRSASNKKHGGSNRANTVAPNKRGKSSTTKPRAASSAVSRTMKK